MLLNLKTLRRLGAVVATGLVLCADPAAPQAYRQERLPELSSFDVGNAASPALVDLDNDDDPDAAVGTSEGSIAYFDNTGSAQAPEFVLIGVSPFYDIAVSGRSSPTFVDLDADGDVDAVAGSIDGNLSFFENIGSSVAPHFVPVAGAASPFDGIDVGGQSSPEFGDLDDDLDFDLVIGRGDGNLIYYENIGSAAEPAFAMVPASPFSAVDVGDNACPELADLDGDGDLDLIVGEQLLLSALHYFRNEGSAEVPGFVQVVGGSDPFFGFQFQGKSEPETVDLDGDDDLDVIVGEGRGTLQYLRNIGSAMAPSYELVVGPTSPFMGADGSFHAAAELVDVDGDGDLDAVLGTTFSPIKYYENTGAPGAPVFSRRIGSSSPFGTLGFGSDALAVVDLDDDSDLEAVVGALDGRLYYLENTGSPSSPAFVVAAGASNPFSGVDLGDWSHPALGDLDGDDDLDAVVGEGQGTLAYFENTGSPTTPTFVLATGAANPFDGIDVGAKSRPELVDLDGDGDLDVAVGTFFNSIIYFQNTGSAVSPAFVEIAGGHHPFRSVELGASNLNLADVDADGDLDLFLGQSDGDVVFFRFRPVGFSDGFETGDTSVWMSPR